MFEHVYALFDGREKVLDSFISGMFPITLTEGTGLPDKLNSIARIAKVSDRDDLSNLKILTSKRMLKRYQRKTNLTGRQRKLTKIYQIYVLQTASLQSPTVTLNHTVTLMKKIYTWKVMVISG